MLLLSRDGQFQTQHATNSTPARSDFGNYRSAVYYKSGIRSYTEWGYIFQIKILSTLSGSDVPITGRFEVRGEQIGEYIIQTVSLLDQSIPHGHKNIQHSYGGENQSATSTSIT